MLLRSFITALACGCLFLSAFTTGTPLSLRGTAPETTVPVNLESTHDINALIEAGRMARITLGFSGNGRRIEAWYFPGTSSYRALVIGGVHGSELSSIEVAQSLIAKLAEGEKTFYSVIVIPSLFPDNAATAMSRPEEMGSVRNIGRYSHATAPDPNRQMPTPGKAFDLTSGVDHMGRVIEWENQLLLQLLERFRPTRIANVHAIRNTGYGGIYADPRTDHLSLAKGYASDSSLAVDMAIHAHRAGGNVKGNRLDKRPNALYYKDPVPVPAGQYQKRNMTGALLNAHRGSGVSLGTWGTTAIVLEDNPAANRDAMRVITLEVPGAKRTVDYSTDAEKYKCEKQIDAFARAIQSIFLGDYYTETNS